MYREPISVQEVFDFEVDCKIKDKQMAYLKAITPKRSEIQAASFELAFKGPFTPDYEYKRSLVDGQVTWWIENIQTEILKCR